MRILLLFLLCTFQLNSQVIDQNVGDNYDEVFFGVYEDMLKQACHYTAIGNHDAYADKAATYFQDFFVLFFRDVFFD